MRVLKLLWIGAILTVVAVGSSGPSGLAQGCSVTLSSTSSLLQAIENASPGAVICLGAGLWREGVLTLTKSLTLRGSGRDQTRLQASLHTEIKRDQELSLTIEALTLERPPGDGLLLFGRARAALTAVTILRAGDDGIDLNQQAQATLRDVQVLESGDAGVELWGQSRLEMQQGVISGNSNGVELFSEAQARIGPDVQIRANYRRGVFVDDKAQLQLVGAIISENSWAGIAVHYEARATLENTQVQRNRLDGIFLFDKAQLVLLRTAIVGNGTAELCRQKEALCTGVTLQDEAQLEARDSQIRENTDWGIAGVLRRCGYEEDDFKGRVSVSNTVVSGNNRAGNHSGETCY